jgi:hypothetical protein
MATTARDLQWHFEDTKNNKIKGADIKAALQRDFADLEDAAKLADEQNKGMTDYADFVAQCAFRTTTYTRSVKKMLLTNLLDLFAIIEPIYTALKEERTAKAITNAVTDFNTGKVEHAKATAFNVQNNGNNIGVYSYNDTTNVTEYALYSVYPDGSVNRLTGHGQSGMQAGNMTKANQANMQRITKGKAKAAPATEAEPAQPAEEVPAVDLDQLVDECTNHSTPAKADEPASQLANLTNQELEDGIAFLSKVHGKDTISAYYQTTQRMIAEMQAILDSRPAAQPVPEPVPAHRPANHERNKQIRRYLSQGHSLNYTAKVHGCSKQHVINIKREMYSSGAL